jgi:hypothetical protein
MRDWLTGGSFVKAIVGHYGSGKTEIALNAAVYLRGLKRRVRLADLDIVNPFFRSAEKSDMLRAHDIEAIYPQFALSAVDMPVLGPEILRAFENDGATSILDVGGDDAGAAALGRYKPQLDAARAELYYVLNPFRPRSRELSQIVALLSLVEARARLRVTGLIANANLGGYTTPDVIREGRALISEVSKETDIPVVAECGLASALEGGPWEQFPIVRYLMPEWMEH